MLDSRSGSLDSLGSALLPRCFPSSSEAFSPSELWLDFSLPEGSQGLLTKSNPKLDLDGAGWEADLEEALELPPSLEHLTDEGSLPVIRPVH